MKYKKYNTDKFSFTREDLSQFNQDVIKEQRRYFILKLIYLLFFTVLISFFFYRFSHYYSNSEYEDNYVFVKQVSSIGYNVYDKDGNLREVKFFNEQGVDNTDIIGYINDNLIYSNTNDKKSSIILENSTSFTSKTKKKDLQGIQIIGIQKIETDKFLILYKKGENNYCYLKNSLDFSQENEFCVKNDGPDISFFVVSYDNYYFIVVDKHIYILDSNKEKVDIIFTSKSPIKNIRQNPNGDIQILTFKGETHQISKIIFEYYLIKKQGQGKDTMTLNLDSMIK